MSLLDSISGGEGPAAAAPDLGGAAAGAGGILAGLGGAGASAGLSLLPAGLGLASSFIQGLGGNKSKKKADANMPGLVDPRQSAFLAELNQKRKAIDTGADFGTAMNAANATNAATNEAITKASGGDTGATIQGLLQSERTTGDVKNQALAQGQGQQLAYTDMFNNLNNKISARAMQLQMQKSQQDRAEWAAKAQNRNQNLMGGLAGVLSGIKPKAAPIPGETNGAGLLDNPSVDAGIDNGSDMANMNGGASFLDNIGS